MPSNFQRRQYEPSPLLNVEKMRKEAPQPYQDRTPMVNTELLRRTGRANRTLQELIELSPDPNNQAARVEMSHMLAQMLGKRPAEVYANLDAHVRVVAGREYARPETALEDIHRHIQASVFSGEMGEIGSRWMHGGVLSQSDRERLEKLEQSMPYPMRGDDAHWALQGFRAAAGFSGSMIQGGTEGMLGSMAAHGLLKLAFGASLASPLAPATATLAAGFTAAGGALGAFASYKRRAEGNMYLQQRRQHEEMTRIWEMTNREDRGPRPEWDETSQRIRADVLGSLTAGASVVQLGVNPAAQLAYRHIFANAAQQTLISGASEGARRKIAQGIAMRAAGRMGVASFGTGTTEFFQSGIEDLGQMWEEEAIATGERLGLTGQDWRRVVSRAREGAVAGYISPFFNPLSYLGLAGQAMYDMQTADVIHARSQAQRAVEGARRAKTITEQQEQIEAAAEASKDPTVQASLRDLADRIGRERPLQQADIEVEAADNTFTAKGRDQALANVKIATDDDGQVTITDFSGEATEDGATALRGVVREIQKRHGHRTILTDLSPAKQERLNEVLEEVSPQHGFLNHAIAGYNRSLRRFQSELDTAQAELKVAEARADEEGAEAVIQEHRETIEIAEGNIQALQAKISEFEHTKSMLDTPDMRMFHEVSMDDIQQDVEEIVTTRGVWRNTEEAEQLKAELVKIEGIGEEGADLVVGMLDAFVFAQNIEMADFLARFIPGAVATGERVGIFLEQEDARGAVQEIYNLGKKAVLLAEQDADASTAIHELSHEFYHFLPESDHEIVREEAAAFFRILPVDVTAEQAQEFFAEVNTRAVTEGRVTSGRMAPLAEKFMRFFRKIIDAIRGRVHVSDRMLDVVQRMYTPERQARPLHRYPQSSAMQAWAELTAEWEYRKSIEEAKILMLPAPEQAEQPAPAAESTVESERAAAEAVAQQAFDNAARVRARADALRRGEPDPGRAAEQTDIVAGEFEPVDETPAEPATYQLGVTEEGFQEMPVAPQQPAAPAERPAALPMGDAAVIEYRPHREKEFGDRRVPLDDPVADALDQVNNERYRRHYTEGEPLTQPPEGSPEAVIAHWLDEGYKGVVQSWRESNETSADPMHITRDMVLTMRQSHGGPLLGQFGLQGADPESVVPDEFRPRPAQPQEPDRPAPTRRAILRPAASYPSEADIQALMDEQELMRPDSTTYAYMAEPPWEVPLEEIHHHPDLPQFKEGADRKGVVRPLMGRFERGNLAPIMLWRRLDGELYIVTGRHRLDLAQRTGEETIPAQIRDEAWGWDINWAIRWDAESNIRDGKGTVQDYANYFRNSDIDKQEASSRGLLSDDKAKQGYAIGRYASDELYALFREGTKIGAAKAAAIAEAAPGQTDVQAAGIKHRNEYKDPQTLYSLVAKIAEEHKTDRTQLDMFGNDIGIQIEVDKMLLNIHKRADEIRENIRTKEADIRVRSERMQKRRAKAGGVSAELASQQQDEQGLVDSLRKEIKELETELLRINDWQYDRGVQEQYRHDDSPTLFQRRKGLEMFSKMPAGQMRKEFARKMAEREFDVQRAVAEGRYVENSTLAEYLSQDWARSELQRRRDERRRLQRLSQNEGADLVGAMAQEADTPQSFMDQLNGEIDENDIIVPVYETAGEYYADPHWEDWHLVNQPTLKEGTALWMKLITSDQFFREQLAQIDPEQARATTMLSRGPIIAAIRLAREGQVPRGVLVEARKAARSNPKEFRREMALLTGNRDELVRMGREEGSLEDELTTEQAFDAPTLKEIYDLSPLAIDILRERGITSMGQITFEMIDGILEEEKARYEEILAEEVGLGRIAHPEHRKEIERRVKQGDQDATRMAKQIRDAERRLADLRERKDAQIKRMKEAQKISKMRKKMQKAIWAKPGKNMKSQYAALLESVQKLTHPIKSQEKHWERMKKIWAQRDELYASFPDLVEMEPKWLDGVITRREIAYKDFTVSHLEELLEYVAALRDAGKAAKNAWKATLAFNRDVKIKILTNAILEGGDRRFLAAPPEYKGNKLRETYLSTLGPERLWDRLDGMKGFKGDAVSLGWSQFLEAEEAYLQELHEHTQAYEDKTSELGIHPIEFSRTHTYSTTVSVSDFYYTPDEAAREADPDGYSRLERWAAANKIAVDPEYVEYSFTIQEIMGMYMALQDPNSAETLIFGNRIPQKVADHFISQLDEKYIELADFMTERYADLLPRIQEFTLDQYDVPIHGPENYFPMVIIDKVYKDYGEEILTEAKQRGPLFVGTDKTNLRARTVIKPEHRRAMRLDAVGLYHRHMDQVSRTLNMEGWARAMDTAMRSDAVQEAAKQMNKEAVLNEVRDWMRVAINPSEVYGRKRTIWDKLRRNSTLMALSLRGGVVLRQFPSIMYYVAAAGPDFFASAGYAMTHPMEVINFVRNNDAHVMARSYDRDMRAAREAARYDPAIAARLERLGERGMGLIKAMDGAVVTVGWYAVYQSVYKKTGDHDAAVNAARRVTLRTQPVGAAAHLPALLRAGGPLSLFTQFSSQINQIWGMMTHDTASYLKSGEYQKAAVTVASVIMAQWSVLAMRRGFQWLPEEDEDFFDFALDMTVPVIPVIGPMYDAYWKGFDMNVPALGWIASSARSAGAVRRVLEGTADAGDLERGAGQLVRTFGAFTGLPAAQINAMIRSFRSDDPVNLLLFGFEREDD